MIEKIHSLLLRLVTGMNRDAYIADLEAKVADNRRVIGNLRVQVGYWRKRAKKEA